MLYVSNQSAGKRQENDLIVHHLTNRQIENTGFSLDQEKPQQNKKKLLQNTVIWMQILIFFTRTSRAYYETSE